MQVQSYLSYVSQDCENLLLIQESFDHGIFKVYQWLKWGLI